MNIGQIFTTILVNPIINILVIIYHGLLMLHISNTLGFSIIILTAVIRLILYPLTASQLKTSKKMQTIAPHINKLKEKHKGDAKTLQAETMKLYQEHGVNPAAGCLPILIQFPILISLYSVLQHVVGADKTAVLKYINSVLYHAVPHLTKLDQQFFGIPLGKTPQDLLSQFGFLILLIPLATFVFQFIQSKMMIPAKAEKADEQKEEKKADDFATAMQTQSLYIFPVMIAFFSFRFAAGLSLYWNTFTIFGILQQYRVGGLGGLKDFFNKKNGK